MILISHRGNIFGPNKDRENSPEYIEEAIDAGYHVEIDVRFYKGDWYLGHDKAQYKVEESFFNNKFLWCHAKNVETFQNLLKLNAHTFFIQDDHVALTSKRYLWLSPTHERIIPGAICVMPEDPRWKNANKNNLSICLGICSDFIESFK